MTSWFSDKRPWWLSLSSTVSLYEHITLHVLYYHPHINIVTISGSFSFFSLQVTQYLTTEFYSMNYSLRQRLDILEVKVLSAPQSDRFLL